MKKNRSFKIFGIDIGSITKATPADIKSPIQKVNKQNVIIFTISSVDKPKDE